MAITPLPAAGLVRPDQSAVPDRPTPGRVQTNVSSLSPDRDISTEERIHSARRGSLLYQIVSKLLLSDEQTQHLNENLSKIDQTPPSSSSDQPLTSRSSQPLPDLIVEIELISLRLDIENNGIAIEARLDWLSFSISQQQEPEQADPLILDLDGNGIVFTSIPDGALFDINNDGRLERMSTIAGEDAFLALDKNNNGRIDDASELFGDQDGALNGFESLKRYDDNHDNLIDSRDQVFSRLLTTRLVDNRQFIEQLADQGVESINLDYQNVASDQESGNRIVQLSDYRTDKGTADIVDVMLMYQQLTDPERD